MQYPKNFRLSHHAVNLLRDVAHINIIYLAQSIKGQQNEEI